MISSVFSVTPRKSVPNAVSRASTQRVCWASCTTPCPAEVHPLLLRSVKWDSGSCCYRIQLFHLVSTILLLPGLQNSWSFHTMPSDTFTWPPRAANCPTRPSAFNSFTGSCHKSEWWAWSLAWINQAWLDHGNVLVYVHIWLFPYACSKYMRTYKQTKAYIYVCAIISQWSIWI